VIGRTLDGKYRIDRLLGQGGMGSVYEAEELGTGRRVAIKLINKNLSGEDGESLIRRFEREARAAGSIDTEHIARCFGAGTDPETGSPFMVLEYLVGEDLQHVLRRLGPLDPGLALRIVAQACQGLAKAHEAKVVHRDIKPANLFLAQAGDGARSVKILDFGVAKIRRDPGEAGGETAGLTRTGSMLGSPLYMSPEQARSVKNVDHRSDIWSMGVVLYQALAGRTPYQHISGLGDLILTLCSDQPPPVQQFAPWVTPEIAAILDFSLRVDPNERFQSAAEMLAALLSLLPDGVEVTEAMLVPLDEETHDHVAPAYLRGFSSTAPVEGRDATASAPVDEARAAVRADAAAELVRSTSGVALGQADASPDDPARRPAQAATATTGPGIPANAADRRHGQGASPRSTVLIALACVIAGGAAVYAFTRPGPSAPLGGPQPGLTVIPATPAPAATAAPTAAVTSPSTPATATATATESASAAPSGMPAPATAAPSKPGHEARAGTRASADPRPPASAAASAGKGIDLSNSRFGDRQ
jgi:serine/threonine-protein kinase